jgi:hypothetical protein
MPANTLALLGDSILDNQPYVEPAPDTAAHLRGLLGASWSVELLARDGATMADLPYQLRHLPRPTTCAVLSIGGNDALEHISLLGQSVSRAADILGPLADIGSAFRERYEPLVTQIRGQVERLIVCTIYEPPLIDQFTARMATVPLAILNDQIIRTAAEQRLDVLELRSVCTDPADFVQDIEPSPEGARKIARSLAAAILAPRDAPFGRIFAE